MEKISIRRGLSAGFEAFKTYPGTAIGGFLLFELVWVVGPLVPPFGYLFSILAAGPLMGGLFKLELNMVTDGDPSMNDIFFGFRHFGPFFGLYWLFIALVVTPAVVTVGIMMAFLRSLGPAFLLQASGQPNLMVGVVGVVVFVLAAYVVVSIIAFKYIFSFFVLAGDPATGVIDALGRSSALTRGHISRIIWAGFVIGLITGLAALLYRLAGLYAFISGGGIVLEFLLGIVSMFIAAPIAGCAMAAIYLQLLELSPGGGSAGRAGAEAAATAAYPPPYTAIPNLPRIYAPANPPGPANTAAGPGTAPVAPVSLVTSYEPLMEQLRLDQASVKFVLRDRDSLLPHGAPITALAISRDGSRIVSAGADGSVKVWNRYRRSLLAGFETGQTISCLAVSPDKSIVLAGCHVDSQPSQAAVRIFAVAGAAEKTPPHPQAAPAAGLAFSPDGGTAASVGADGVKVWEASSGREIMSGRHPEACTAAAFSLDGNRIVSVSRNWTIIVWDLKSASQAVTWTSGEPAQYRIALAGGGEWMAAQKESTGACVLIDVRTGRQAAQWFTQGRLAAAYASAEDSVVVWEIQAGSLKAYHAQGGRYLQTVESRSQTTKCVAVSTDGMCVCAGGADGVVELLEAT